MKNAEMALKMSLSAVRIAVPTNATTAAPRQLAPAESAGISYVASPCTHTKIMADSACSSSGRKRDLQDSKPRRKQNRKRRKGGGIDCLDVSELDVDILPLVIDSVTGEPVAAADVSSDDIVKRIRIVRPYPFTFATFSKKRWLGRTILDVYHQEFGSYPRSYYESAINEGRILVSGKRVTCDYLVAQHDELSHTVHRHEPAVAICDGRMAYSGEKTLVRVIHEDDEIIVLDKPPTLPIHPCGGYNYNSLVHILVAQDPKLKDRLSPIHRLDRLTSGLSIIAKKKDVAKKMGKCILDREHCQKVYLTRVKGKFPCRAPMDKRIISDSDGSEHPYQYGEDKDGKACLGYWISDCRGNIQREATLQNVFDARRPVDEILGELKTQINDTQDDTDSNKRLWFHLSCPCRIASHKNGVCEAGEFSGLDDELAKKVKPAQTAFAVVAYDEKSDSTIALVKPETGRMHQIRLHCQYLGHPIANDVNYGGDLFFDDPAAALASRKAKEKMSKIDATTSDHSEGTPLLDAPRPASETEIADATAQTTRAEGEQLLDFIKKTCVWCARSKGEDREMLEFLSRSRGIFLHALQYSLKVDYEDGKGERNLCYRTPLPNWAKFGETK